MKQKISFKGPLFFFCIGVIFTIFLFQAFILSPMEDLIYQEGVKDGMKGNITVVVDSVIYHFEPYPEEVIK